MQHQGILFTLLFRLCGRRNTNFILQLKYLYKNKLHNFRVFAHAGNICSVSLTIMHNGFHPHMDGF